MHYGFDGIDIDCEYPVSGDLPGNTTRPEDKGNFTLLLAELRAQLNEQGVQDGRHYFLTIMPMERLRQLTIMESSSLKMEVVAGGLVELAESVVLVSVSVLACPAVRIPSLMKSVMALA